MPISEIRVRSIGYTCNFVYADLHSIRIHFLVLGLALEDAEALDGFLRLTDMPLVKVAEWGLVMLLALHLSFGLRVLVLEFLPWRDSRKGLILAGSVGAVAVGAVFAAQILVL